MELRIFAIGDVVGEEGLDFVARNLRRIQRDNKIDFTVVNGENMSGVGLLPVQAKELYDAGADVITLGNHTWNRLQIQNLMDDVDWILRPANYTNRVPGRGIGVYDGPRGVRIAVMNLIGRCDLDFNAENPFTTADRLLKDLDADLCLVDFHAEATSEKGAMGYYLDGRVQAVWGTHTHVPTADTQILPKGTGFVTDLGMTGPAQSVLGVRPQQAIGRFLGALPSRFESAPGPRKLEGVVFTLDTKTRTCLAVQRLDIAE